MGTTPITLADTPHGAYWVADGFRFSRVADFCDAVPYSAILSLRIAGVELATPVPDVGGITSHADLHIALQTGLADIVGKNGGETYLLGLRRGSVIADVELRGKEAYVVEAVKLLQREVLAGSSSRLRASLCAAAGGDASCHVELLGLVVDTQSAPGASQTGAVDPRLMVAFAVVGLAIVVNLAVCCWRFGCRKKPAEVTDVGTADKDIDAVCIVDVVVRPQTPQKSTFVELEKVMVASKSGTDDGVEVASTASPESTPSERADSSECDTLSTTSPEQ